MPTFDSSEPIPLSSRFAKLKRNMIACREKDVAESFYRLIRALRKEADDIATRGSDVIPTIDYFDIHDSVKASAFRKALRKRGVAVIKRVVPLTTAQTWKEETLDYIAENPQARGHPSHDPQLFDLYWSPSQVRARADSRLLDAQRFAMSTWHASDEQALVSTEYPVAYADRLRVRTHDDIPLPSSAHVDNGSVERWEPDGYGASGTYHSIFSGRWEDYDPWDSSPRLHITTDLYNRSGSCSMFRMFQGFLSLSSIPARSGALTVCPMLELSTAYLLLRPFFTPRYKNPAAKIAADHEMGMGARRTELDFLHPNNWNLNVSQTSILHGAVPGYQHELTTTLHPHLQLQRTMVSVPDLEPGDYVIWHPDVVHAVDGTYFPTDPNLNFSSPNPFSPSITTSIAHRPHPRYSSDTTILYIPACPLTQTNALYLARQRRAFLLGLAAPDFSEAGNGSSGERDHAGRSGVQDVADAGGEDGLRSMGLAPFEEISRRNSGSREPREKEKDIRLLRLANGILFPDRFDGVLKKGGGRR
ncbi:hypothetical protein EV127DRAFT_461244 [Xylaria flabelliformis]|nr:hypothetical protein EV127DRAFT_461244 [Xylaria flabelliformis]